MPSWWPIREICHLKVFQGWRLIGRTEHLSCALSVAMRDNLVKASRCWCRRLELKTQSEILGEKRLDFILFFGNLSVDRFHQQS